MSRRQCGSTNDAYFCKKRRISYVSRVADYTTLGVHCINAGLHECVWVCGCVLACVCVTEREREREREREKERERERERPHAWMSTFFVSLCGFGWACGHVISSAVIVKESRSGNSKGQERGREKWRERKEGDEWWSLDRSGKFTKRPG